MNYNDNDDLNFYCYADNDYDILLEFHNYLYCKYYNDNYLNLSLNYAFFVFNSLFYNAIFVIHY